MKISSLPNIIPIINTYRVKGFDVELSTPTDNPTVPKADEKSNIDSNSPKPEVTEINIEPNTKIIK